MRANWDAVVEIDDVLIKQADAAARDGVAGALWLVGAVYANFCDGFDCHSATRLNPEGMAETRVAAVL